ncbi:uncharacterized protein LOC144149185 [Haemaphysalis longicornis]
MILPCSLLVLAATFPQGTLGEYYGVKIGAIFTKKHDFKGVVYAANENQLFIKGMTYDGTGPVTRSWTSTSIPTCSSRFRRKSYTTITSPSCASQPT